MSIAKKLTAVAENQQKVYEAGKRAQWSALWDAIQQGTGYVSYEQSALFRGPYWNDAAFKPKYDIVTSTSNQYMFKECQITDLKGILDGLGRVLDTSAGTNFFAMFQGSTITHIPTINAQNAANLNQTFFNCTKLVSIEKLIVCATATFGSSFSYCSALEILMIEGVIGSKGFNVQWSTKLTHDSLMSIINALETKTSGTWTVTLGTENLAKLTDEEKAIATEKGWTLA